ncbi:uncharacterized protein LOC117175053 isoform X2 [Belonocnema kinseyi]|uniref:uncharacterized protein LOC117175053 isoform X2 n=1 Tax=Belonocnema kinseyi TaxID=2817044 RepID=UPI00143D29A1|nr:uncharacterized protein LOC117175053 isoform X2 [Belonocnema kinseyi]
MQSMDMESKGTQTDFEDFDESKVVESQSTMKVPKVRSTCIQTSKRLIKPLVIQESLKNPCSMCKDIPENSKSPAQRFEDSLKNYNDKCIFYTGLHFKYITVIMSFIGDVANSLNYWGSSRKSNANEKHKARRKLTPLQELILVLTRLRCGLLLEGMSYRFEVSVELLSSINITWIQCLYLHFSTRLRPKMFASRRQVEKYLPKIFRNFKNLRVILDCTEFFCEAPAKFEHQGNLYSQYKGHTTF